MNLPGGVVNTITYDGDGRRRSYHDSAGLRRFLWDGENIARQTDSGGSTNRRYTLRPEVYGELISQDGPAFHHYDALGSTRQLSDGSQAVTDSRDYRAFGATNASSGSNPNRFWWNGKWGYYWQPDPGNYWLRARVYEDDNARFLSRDPAMANVNAYRYANNNPVTLTDPAGLQACRTPSDPWWRHRRAGAGLGAAAMAGPGRGGMQEPLMGGGGMGGPPRMRVRCGGSETMCCEVPRPGLGWWAMPQGRPHENWEEASCSCGESPPNCTVTLHKRVLGNGDKWVEQKMVRKGRCVPCGEVIPGWPEYPGGRGVILTDGKPGREEKKCGPEIGGALAKTLRNIESYFHSHPSRQERMCGSLLTPLAAFSAWDIQDLWDGGWMRDYGGACGIGRGCRDTVEVDGVCFHKVGVNWVAFGTMMRLCGHSKLLTYTAVYAWRVIISTPLRLLWDPLVYAEAQQWAATGWEGYPGHFPWVSLRQGCKRCGLSYTPDSGHWTVKWGPEEIL